MQDNPYQNLPFFACVKKDLKAQLDGKQGTGSYISAFLFGRGFHLLLSHRIQKLLLRVPVAGKFIAKILWYFTSSFTGCEIPYNSKIQGGVYIPHPTGIVIGENAEIGTGVTLYQQVTIGTREKGSLKYPRIGNHVYLGAGCKIIGGIEIGENAVIGANAVVLKDIPANATAVGIPASIKQKVIVKGN